LRQYAEHEPDAFDRLLLPTAFDYEHSRLRSFPASLRSLRLAPPPQGLHPGRRRLGDLTVQDVRSASAGDPGFLAQRFSSARSRRHRASDIPVAAPWPSLRLREARFRRVSRDRDMQAVREEPPATNDPECLPSPASRAMRGLHPPRKRSREGFRCDEGASVCSLAAAYFRTLELRARRPSLNASRSGEMESVRFSAPATVCRLLQQHQRRASTTSSVRSSRASTGGLYQDEPVPTRWPSLPVRLFRGARLAVAPPLPRESRQRATSAPSTPSPGQYKSAER